MKKFLRISALILVVLVGLLALAPFLFKDEIKAAVTDTVNESLKAEVYFGDVSLSFFRNFPNVRLSVSDFGVVNQAPFAGDTLAQGKQMALVVDLLSLLNAGPIAVKQVLLIEPDLRVRVLADGQANYDIVAADSSAGTPTSADSSSFQLNLQEYAIENGRLFYEDATLPLQASIKGLNHRGRGDFTESIYDLVTQTEAERVRVVYDNITYLNQALVKGDITLNIDLTEDLKVRFLENQLTVNDLTVAFEGDLAMPGEDIVMDLRFAAQETDFRSLLSLVPGVFTEDFASLKTDGQLVFDGFAKGTYSETKLPGFGLNLKVKEGFLQYPDLPTPVKNLALDLALNCPDGNLEALQIGLKQLHADLGTNPVDARADIEGLSHMKIDGEVKADLNLGELTQIFPLEGTALKGQFFVDATASGVYDDTKNQFPQVSAVVNLENGYVKNEEYPAELTELQFHGKLDDADGSLTSAKLDIPDFHFLLDGEPLDGSAYIANFDSPFYRIKAHGRLDLAKLMQIYPIDSMTLRGMVDVQNFETEGQYADLEAERYDKLNASGSARVNNLYYSDLWYVQPGFLIEAGEAQFTADKLIIQSSKGKIGKSDYQATGYLDNYLAFGLMPNQPLGGKVTIQSNRFDVNEWMAAEEGESSGTTGEEAPWEVIPVPDYLNMEIAAQIGEVIYDDLNLEKFSGVLTIADETVSMADLRFGMFGSQVAMNGIYNTQSLTKPSYNFYLNVADLGVKDAYTYFSPVQAFAPALAFINGVCNTELGLSGYFKPDMSPVLENMDGLGQFLLKKGTVEEAPLFMALADKTKLDALRNFSFEDIKGKFEIKEGFLIVAPLDFEYKGIKMRLGGRQNLAGGLDYDVMIDAPSGQVGTAAFQALNQLSGGVVQASDRVVVNLKVGGTSKKPVITGGGGGTGDAVKDELTQAAEDKLNQELGTDLQLNKDSLKAQADQFKKDAADSLKKVVDQKTQQAKDSLKSAGEALAKEKAKALEEELRKQVGDSAANQLQNLKDRFGIGKKKKN